MAVSVIVSNFNGAQYLPRLLATLAAQQGVSAEIIVVDRHSTDGSVQILAQHPSVRVLQAPAETGLVAGYDAGTRVARYEQLFFCNEDMWFAPDCLAQLEAHIDLTRKVACADPWQWSYDGSKLIHAAPQIRRQWNRSSPHPWFPFPQNDCLSAGNLIASPCAGAMMLHRFAYDDVGGWDTAFFLDHEDTDLAIRLWQRGWLAVTVPQAKVYHAVGASNPKSLANGRHSVARKRYVHGIANQMAVGWKLFPSKLWPLPIAAWTETLAKDLCQLRWQRAAWDVLGMAAALKRVPQICRFRRFNRMASAHNPASGFFRDRRLYFGSAVRPSSVATESANPPRSVQLSIALVTRNRPVSLRRCLESWRGQSAQPLEFIVSDDSESQFIEENKAIAGEFGCRYLSGPRRGLYANRNNAALACRGTHIMSADDDHTHPPGFTETVLRDIALATDSVWTYGEKHPRRPLEPVAAPGELKPDNRIGPPEDPSWSSAIADGCSVYPSDIFQSGLRFDETYPFGGTWYLWGRKLSRSGVRIRYSPRTFVWHNSDTVLERAGDGNWAKAQIECNLYVAVRNAVREHKSLLGMLRALLAIVRSVLICQSPPSEKTAIRLGPAAVARAVRNALT